MCNLFFTLQLTVLKSGWECYNHSSRAKGRKHNHMTHPPPHQITQLLEAWSDGDRSAYDKLIPLVYDELHRLAHRYMIGERAGHTLQTSALVGEAYLRLVGQRGVRWQNRTHFLAIAAQLMRRILVDHARTNARAKRGGGAQMLDLDETAIISP